MNTFRLAPTAAAAGYRMEAFASVGSTNAMALERAARGEAGPLWLVSKRQEAGRGRRGRIWATEEGNLAATLLLGGLADIKSAATLGFVAGLSLGEALEALAPEARVATALDAGGSGRSRFALKWPNDVLASGAKLAGILLESSVLSNQQYAVAVGIGVNVISHPTDLPYPATSLSALGVDVDAETLFLALSDAWTTYCAIWDQGRGTPRIRDLWLERAAGLGGEVAVRIDGDVVRGTFETIDSECRFVIRDQTGELRTITAGDVHFGTVASAAPD